MSYDLELADRVRTALSTSTKQPPVEKKMFRGLAFLVNGKMCVNISGQNLMCRFDPLLEAEVSVKAGYQPMRMKGKPLAGYCYVEPVGLETIESLNYWINLCLSYNPKAKASKRKKPLSAKKENDQN